jgi:hypothetical protein
MPGGMALKLTLDINISGTVLKETEYSCCFRTSSNLVSKPNMKVPKQQYSEVQLAVFRYS